MLRPGLNSKLTVLVLCGIALADWRAAAVEAAPDYREVREILRAHLPGVTEADLDRAAVSGLVSTFSPKVRLVPQAAAASVGALPAVLVSRTNVFDETILYVRVNRVEAGLDEAVRQACQSKGGTNVSKGVILDLRFAGGSDYAAAAGTAELFVKPGQPLLDWGGGMVVAKEKSEGSGLPVAVLVNRKTAGAAEALAAILRKAGTGLILGDKTSGEATMAQEYPLANGDRLLIATKPIQLGDGSTLSDGVEPDIGIRISPVEERAYYDDGFKAIAAAGSAAGAGTRPDSAGDPNAARRPRLNEKELVRERREGLANETDLAPARVSGRTGPGAGPGGDPEKPLVHDPALARAIDLLKGLAVVRAARS